MLTHRSAGPAEIPQLVELNLQLIEGENYPKRYSIEELTARWQRWLAGGYEAVLLPTKVALPPTRSTGRTKKAASI